jgi:hypothetical protein
MPSPPVIFCGFADVKLFCTCKTADDLNAYNVSMVHYPKMKFDKNYWMEKRKRMEAVLKDRYVKSVINNELVWHYGNIYCNIIYIVKCNVIYQYYLLVHCTII